MASAEELFAAHRQGVFRYLCRALGDREAAGDLAQDVFLRVSRSHIPEAPSSDLRAWVFRIARNLSLDFHRRRRRRPESPAVEDEVPLAASQDITLAVNQALASLSDVDRDVFLMREVAGLSYDEIALVCELTRDAVRSRIHRTRLELRSQLAPPLRAMKPGPNHCAASSTRDEE